MWYFYYFLRFVVSKVKNTHILIQTVVGKPITRCNVFMSTFSDIAVLNLFI